MLPSLNKVNVDHLQCSVRNLRFVTQTPTRYLASKESDSQETLVQSQDSQEISDDPFHSQPNIIPHPSSQPTPSVETVSLNSGLGQQTQHEHEAGPSHAPSQSCNEGKIPQMNVRFTDPYDPFAPKQPRTGRGRGGGAGRGRNRGARGDRGGAKPNSQATPMELD